MQQPSGWTLVSSKRPAAVNGQFAVPAGGQLKVPHLAWYSGGAGAAPSSVAGFAHPVALAVGDDGVAVVQESVGQADGGGVLGQEAAPVLERVVAADAEGAAFVGGGDEPEQQLGAGVVQRSEAELVEDDQVIA